MRKNEKNEKWKENKQLAKWLSNHKYEFNGNDEHKANSPVPTTVLVHKCDVYDVVYCAYMYIYMHCAMYT